MRRACAVACGLLAVLYLVACGGGGGGGSSSPYTGLITPAAIENTNAEEIALGAYYGGEMSDTSFMPGVLALHVEGAAQPPVKIVALVRTLEKVTDSLGRQTQAAAMMGQASPSTVYPVSGTEDGIGGGTVSYSLSWDDQNGAFGGTFSFQDYDDGSGVVLSGPIGVSGTTSIYYAPNALPGDILEITLGFSSFTATDGVDTFRISGTLHLDFGIPTGPSIATMNLYVKDLSTGKAVWINDYTVTVAEGADFIDVMISGRFYLHDYGYVDVSTDQPFRLYGNDVVGYDEFPSSGSLVVTGKDGCKARLTALDNTRYRVEVDVDPVDGKYEWLVEGFWV